MDICHDLHLTKLVLAQADAARTHARILIPIQESYDLDVGDRGSRSLGPGPGAAPRHRGGNGYRVSSIPYMSATTAARA